MFFGSDRESLVRDMFIAGEMARRDRGAGETGAHAAAYSAALTELAKIQRSDFVALLEAMEGAPVTIRLLDPPLHEFIGAAVFAGELTDAEARGDAEAVAAARERIAVAGDLEEVNPMLGTRGARLGLHLGGLYEMQVRAIAEAALEVAGGGELPDVEVMIPLVAFPNELSTLRTMVEATVADVLGPRSLSVGTMIELPAACLAADRIAANADFFSFGTNDLTQTALGLSRDDAERGFLPGYIEHGIVERSPFETIDVVGVGGLVAIAVERGRKAKPGLSMGVCGEHGGDPDSIAFFDGAGIDYVSCSPFRVPIARVAAARAALSG
jgi:pyruvate,orthophosphate dikinase